MGFWSMIMVYYLAHDMLAPLENWKEAGISPLPDYVDTGGYLVTKDNVQYFKNINNPQQQNIPIIIIIYMINVIFIIQLLFEKGNSHLNLK